jgi:hypothetical protein
MNKSELKEKMYVNEVARLIILNSDMGKIDS